MGLRLIKSLVWPDNKNDEEDDQLQQDEVAPTEQQKNQINETEVQQSIIIKEPRRIITYMSPSENTTHVRKEYFKVDYQEVLLGLCT